MLRALRRSAGPAGRCALAALALLAAQACRTAADQTAASVDGEPITYAEIERYEWLSRDQWVGAEESHRPPGWRLGALRELIDQRILVRRARVQGLQPSDAEVDGAVQRRRTGLGTDEAGLSRILESRGITTEQFRAHLRNGLAIERLVSQEADSKVRVSVEEMRAYYDANVGAFSVYELQLRLAQILVDEAVVSPIPNLRNDDVTGRAAAREKIRWIADQLRDGASFEQLARDYSEDPLYAATGGDMGYVPLSAMDETDIRLRRAVNALEVGENSAIVETGGEYRIVRLVSIEEPGQRSFDSPDVQDAIRAVLRNRKEQLLREAVYEVERNRSKIRNYLAERIVADPDAER